MSLILALLRMGATVMVDPFSGWFGIVGPLVGGGLVVVRLLMECINISQNDINNDIYQEKSNN
jgi:hypothetical protein